ncbi:MAG: conjugative transposon protein TraM [Chitinophagaceae bacterium]|jgi:conjugative transposon TraM protein|nr:conjugative transposon protein TraM [Chitinophagaceae bacterium]
MKSEQRSQAFLRKRKMMLVLPLLVIPFLTMAFWALGGGTGSKNKNPIQTAGLNLNLPDAQLKDDKGETKLSFYDKADKDSLKLLEQIKNDPFYLSKQDSFTSPVNEIEQLTVNSASKFNQRLNTSPYSSALANPEERLMEKLAQLQNQINQPENSTTEKPGNEKFAVYDDEFSQQVNQLQNMMQGMTENNTEDTEMKQLGNTLDKILDIQHPDRVKERLKEKSQKQKETVFIVSKYPAGFNISLLDTNKRKINQNDGFYGLENTLPEHNVDNAIEAIIPENTILVNNAVIKLRLATDIYINGVLIPKNNMVSGLVSLENERLQVEINSIRYNNSLFLVKLEVYDMDGLAGIYIPGAISRDVAKQSADNSLQLMELTTLDPSLKAQAAAAGINTVKSMLSKKVKQVKVMVKAGYRVLLRDKNIQDK